MIHRNSIHNPLLEFLARFQHHSRRILFVEFVLVIFLINFDKLITSPIFSIKILIEFLITRTITYNNILVFKKQKALFVAVPRFSCREKVKLYFFSHSGRSINQATISIPTFSQAPTVHFDPDSLLRVFRCCTELRRIVERGLRTVYSAHIHARTFESVKSAYTYINNLAVAPFRVIYDLYSQLSHKTLIDALIKQSTK